MKKLLNVVPFYLQSLEYNGYFIGFEDNTMSVLTQNKEKIRHLNEGDYWTGYLRYDIENTENGLYIDNKNNVRKMRRGRSWNESFGLHFFDKDKGIMTINQGGGQCISGPSINSKLIKRKCTNKNEEKFQVLFTKDEPGFLTPKNTDTIAIYMPMEKGKAVEMRDLRDASPLYINLQGNSAPIVLKDKPEIAWNTSDYKDVQSEPLNFSNYNSSTIYRVIDKNGVYRIEQSEPEGRKLCASHNGSQALIKMVKCNSNDEQQLFKFLKESAKSQALSRLAVKDTFMINSSQLDVAAFASESNRSKLTASGKDMGSIFNYDDGLKVILLNLSDLAVTNEQGKAILTKNQATAEQKMEIKAINENEIMITNKNGAFCLTQMGFEGTQFEFEECDETNKKQKFNLSVKNSPQNSRDPPVQAVRSYSPEDPFIGIRSSKSFLIRKTTINNGENSSNYLINKTKSLIKKFNKGTKLKSSLLEEIDQPPIMVKKLHENFIPITKEVAVNISKPYEALFGKPVVPNIESLTSETRIFIYSKNESAALSAPAEYNYEFKMVPTRKAMPFVYNPNTKRLHDIYNPRLVMNNVFSEGNRAIMIPINDFLVQEIEFFNLGNYHVIKNMKKCLTRFSSQLIKFDECTGDPNTLWKINLVQAEAILSSGMPFDAEPGALGENDKPVHVEDNRGVNRNEAVTERANFAGSGSFLLKGKLSAVQKSRFLTVIKNFLIPRKNREKSFLVTPREMRARGKELEHAVKDIIKNSFEKKGINGNYPSLEPENVRKLPEIKEVDQEEDNMEVVDDENEDVFDVTKVHEATPVMIHSPDNKIGLFSPGKNNHPFIIGPIRDVSILIYDPVHNTLHDSRHMDMVMDLGFLRKTPRLKMKSGSKNQDINIIKENGKFYIKHHKKCLIRKNDRNVVFGRCNESIESQWVIDLANLHRQYPNNEFAFILSKKFKPKRTDIFYDDLTFTKASMDMLRRKYNGPEKEESEESEGFDEFSDRTKRSEIQVKQIEREHREKERKKRQDDEESIHDQPEILRDNPKLLKRHLLGRNWHSHGNEKSKLNILNEQQFPAHARLNNIERRKKIREIPNTDQKEEFFKLENLKEKTKLLIYNYDRTSGLISPGKKTYEFQMASLDNLEALVYDPLNKTLGDFGASDLVMEHDEKSGNSLLNLYNKQMTQKITFVGGKFGYLIENNGKCLSRRSAKTVEFGECLETPETVWKINVLGKEGKNNERLVKE
ncbi:hypothetical protein NUSPORA_00982 [Nucleospora cyclopteri]